MIIAIDFNGTIEDSSKAKGKKLGPPTQGAEEAIEELVQAGAEIVVFTNMATRKSGQRIVADWLDRHDISYSEITSIKPNADLFIDDRALHHLDWDRTLREVSLRLRGLDLELD